jgi:membrane protein YdbS with pleckstrin-like domain
MDTVYLRPSKDYKKVLYIAVIGLTLLSVTSWTIPTALLITAEEEIGPGLLIIAVTANLLLFTIGAALVGPYFRSMRYEIHEDEVIVHVGIITQSVKHVPFRTITNLKITRGPLERLFGIGSLAIQTAGMSGPNSQAEQDLKGLPNVQEVYEKIGEKLRHYRSAMRSHQAGEESAELETDALLRGILEEMRGIRADLKRE